MSICPSFIGFIRRELFLSRWCMTLKSKRLCSRIDKNLGILRLFHLFMTNLFIGCNGSGNVCGKTELGD
jgi:hypothetical protein